ncbi:MAG: PglZ domain-containing protein [Actinobacteria bacterium]|nr:PglZ domain-containing protein [Actinomycetota bacterium]
MNVHLSQITPSIFSSLGLSTSEDHLAMGPSPSGRELLFLIDGFGADVIEKYADVMPTISRLTKFSTIQTSFPSTTATSLANVAADLIAETKAALQKTPSFVYLYVNDLDVAGHSDGVGSEKWLAALGMIDQMFSSLMKEMPQGTRIWLTSDHGMVNASEKIIIGDDNPLLEGVAVIGGEPRARHLYLSPENDSLSARSELASRWQEYLGERATVLTRESAIASELFGRDVSADALDRMGEVIAIAQSEVVLLDPERAEKEGAMVGHHGGDSEIESEVGLLTTTLS